MEKHFHFAKIVLKLITKDYLKRGKLKKNIRAIISSVFIITIILFSGAFNSVKAATNSSNSITSSGNGFRISPVRTDLVIERGQAKVVTIYITNVTSTTVSLRTVVDDFQSRDETGTPALLTDGQSLPRHGLKQYTKVPSDIITLNPGQQKTTTATVSIPSNAVPGGYFGAVRFAPTDQSGDKNVNLAASVGSLILVKVPGEVKEVVSISSFGVGRGGSPHGLFFSNKNLQAIVKFQNSGDVQEQPFGKIQLKKGNTVLSSHEINDTQPRGNVLPDSTRKFTVQLDNVGKFGKFTIEGNFGYGSNGQLLSSKSTFYVIPMVLILGVIAGIAILVSAIYFVPKAVRRHDRRILRQNKRNR